MNTIVHADDFGLTVAQSQTILDLSSACGGAGALNSTSAMVTSPAFPIAAELARLYVENGSLAFGLHLNLVEGHALSNPKDIPLLTDNDGMFNRGFVSLLRMSYSGKHDELRSQVKTEAAAQINLLLETFPNLKDRLRIDSHQHFHMIPAVFEGLLDAIDETGCTVEHIRIPAEPMAPYKESRNVRNHISAINTVKNKILNHLWEKNLKKYGEETLPFPKYPLFFGLALSGQMQFAEDEEFLAKARTMANAQGRDLEILFHPGGVENVSECLNPNLKGFCEFYLSDNRKHEAEALKKLESLL